MKRKLRFLNMEPEQVARRAQREKKQTQRKNAKAKRTQSHNSSRSATNPRSSARHRMRPCCGHFVTACTCKPPAGLQKPPLDALAARYRTTPLKTVRDTTDVSIFQRLMQQRCESLPIWVVLLYSFVHVMFNQEQVLKAMVDEKAFLFKPPWVNWTRLKAIIRKAKKTTRNPIVQLLQSYIEMYRSTDWLQAACQARRCYRTRRSDLPACSVRFSPAGGLQPLRHKSYQRVVEGNAEGVATAS